MSCAATRSPLAMRAVAAGAKVKSPMNTSWNTRELSVNDPDGYVLTFSEPLDPKKKVLDIKP